MKGNVILFAALILSLLAALLFVHRWRQTDSQLRETVRWTHFVMDSLSTSMNLPAPPPGVTVHDSLYWQWLATTAELQARRSQQAVRHWVKQRSTLLDEVAIAKLKREGLDDPARQLRESLASRTDLIPFPGELGGTMAFHSDEDIILLWPPYVFAEFDDGHVQGSMLLEYSVEPGPKVEWKRLWATLE
jgi:hypothetical protein